MMLRFSHSSFPPRRVMFYISYIYLIQGDIKWGASSRWTFRPDSTWGGIAHDYREDAPHFTMKLKSVCISQVTWVTVRFGLHCELPCVYNNFTCGTGNDPTSLCQNKTSSTNIPYMHTSFKICIGLTGSNGTYIAGS